MEKLNKTLTVLIGCLVNDSDIQRLVTHYFKGSVSVSNLAYEKKLFDGFKSANVGDVIFLSAPVVGNYPTTSKKMIVKGFTQNSMLSIVKYSCLLGYRNVSKSKALKKRLKTILKDKINGYDLVHVISCEYHKPYLECLKLSKEIFGAKTTLIVPDLPRHVGNHGPFYKYLKKKGENKLHKLINDFVDSFVCFTEDINSEINKGNKPFIISEGIMNKIHYVEPNHNDGLINCTYIGKLDKTNGVELLAEASKKLPSNYVVNVYGSGEMEDALRRIKDSRLIYHGFIKPDEVFSILDQSDILLSPRFSEEEYTRFSFPSKIFDYLSSSKPIVTFRLPCYFKELDEIVYYIEEETPEAVAEAIIKTSNRGSIDYNKFDDIYQKYNPKSVANKIHELIGK